MHFVLLGCGGVGYSLAFTLVRSVTSFARASKSKSSLLLVDGDKIEAKNVARCFGASEVGLCKADVLQDSLKRIVDPDFCSVESIPLFFLRDADLAKVHYPKWLGTAEPLVVLSCVDNVATRKILQEELDSRKAPTILIDGGNNLTHGQATVWMRMHDKHEPWPTLFELYPEAAKVKDNLPNCTENMVSQPQSVMTNHAVGTAMLMALNKVLSETLSAPITKKVNYPVHHNTGFVDMVEQNLGFTTTTAPTFTPVSAETK